MTVLGDPNAMTTAELRSARANLQMQEDVISFVRRMAQGRCDLARDE
ncbi:MAG: aerial mycelium formation protein, partial [Actinobacteria bacterium]|nr:aerial mycelium formation protein [Actinomycetota bacterium]